MVRFSGFLKAPLFLWSEKVHPSHNSQGFFTAELACPRFCPSWRKCTGWWVRASHAQHSSSRTAAFQVHLSRQEKLPSAQQIREPHLNLWYPSLVCNLVIAIPQIKWGGFLIILKDQVGESRKYRYGCNTSSATGFRERALNKFPVR